MNKWTCEQQRICVQYLTFFQQLEVERFRHAKSSGDHATKQMAQRMEDVCRPEENASRCAGQLTRGKRFILKSTSATLEMLQRKSKKTTRMDTVQKCPDELPSINSRNEKKKNYDLLLFLTR